MFHVPEILLVSPKLGLQLTAFRDRLSLFLLMRFDRRARSFGLSLLLLKPASEADFYGSSAKNSLSKTTGAGLFYYVSSIQFLKATNFGHLFRTIRQADKEDRMCRQERIVCKVDMRSPCMYFAYRLCDDE